jgi:outer membrane protein assembly factor BamB
VVGWRAAAAVGLLAAGDPLLAGDWPQFLGPTRNATSTETGLNLSWPAKGPPLLWDREVGEGYSGPVVVGDRLILFHRQGDEEVVECLDAGSGQSRWRFAYPTGYVDDYGKGNGPRATPLVAGNRVYTLGAEGMLHCLDRETGKQVWGRSLQADYQPKKGFFGVASSPIVVADKLLVNVGAKGASIVAFDRETGKEVWKALDHEASYSSPVSASFDGQTLVIFFTREGLVAIEPERGKVVLDRPWRSRLHASVNAAAPVVAGDLVFVSAEYATGAIVHRFKDGRFQELWKGNDSISNHYNTSIHQGGFLYGIDGRQEGGAAQLRCIDLASGKVLWSQPRFGCASMILVQGHLLALAESGELVLVEASPRSYREKARVPLLKPPCRAEIALANGRLYARDNHRLVCLDLTRK